MRKNLLIFIGAAVIALIAAPNAQAYFFQLPDIFRSGTRLVQNGPTESNPSPAPMPAPTTEPTPTTPTLTKPVEPNMAPQEGAPGGGASMPAPMPMPREPKMMGPTSPSPQEPRDSTSAGPTCNINGVEVPGRCEDMEKNGRQGPMVSEEDMEKRQKEQEQRQLEQEQRQLQDMKRGAQQVQMSMRNFEFMLKQLTKQGIAIPQEIQDKMAKLKGLVEAIKSAQSVEEMQDLGFDEIHEIMRDLDEFRQDFAEKELRMRDMKRGLRGMEQNLKMFERQLAQLEKQKIAIPSGVKEALDKVKTILAAVKAAKSWDEMEAAGIEDLQDLMQTLDENRQSLEMLARWPQTLKQVERELKNLTKELKRSKLIVDRLLKKEIDLTSIYAEFETAVNKLKSVKDDAVAKMQAGDGESAFDLVQNDFFGQMEDVWQNQRIIMTMSNLGRFASDFKRGIADSQRLIKQLKRQKIDTTELEAMLNQAKIKGEEILALLKTKPIDEEVIMAGLQEMENMRQEFESEVADLTGKEKAMPWEQGPEVLKAKPALPSNWQKIAPQKKTETTPSTTEALPTESNPSPAPMPTPSIPAQLTPGASMPGESNPSPAP